MGLRFCHVCDGDTLEGASIDRGGATACCSSCGTPYPKIVEPAKVVVDPETQLHVVVPAAKPVEAPGVAVQYSLPGVPAPVAAKKVAKALEHTVASATKPRDALRDIRARRRAIKSEVKRLRDLEAEDRELAAAEHAIEAARRADVTPIRSAK